MHNTYLQYLFLKPLLRVSMFIHHQQGVFYYARQSYKINKMNTFIKMMVTKNH